jgi:hypothetical protein
VSDERERRLADLRKAFESGNLDEAIYKAAIVGLGDGAGPGLRALALSPRPGVWGAWAGGVAVGGGVRNSV